MGASLEQAKVNFLPVAKSLGFGAGGRITVDGGAGEVPAGPGQRAEVPSHVNHDWELRVRGCYCLSLILRFVTSDKSRGVLLVCLCHWTLGVSVVPESRHALLS